MNNKAKIFLKNFSYTLSSNLISLLISTIVILIVPKLIGVEDYGYWQLYIFYSSYVGFLHFGWNDGIYLRYGGREYKELNKELFFKQFWMMFLLQIFLGILIIGSSIILIDDTNKLFIIKMTSLCMLIVNVRLMLTNILQCTNRIKEYAQIVMLERVLYCTLIIFFLLLGNRQFDLLIMADLIGKFIALTYSIYFCKDIVFRKVTRLYINFIEVFENINAGIKLMFANIAFLFIIGIVRLGIERTWSISTFGKVSLTLSISNLMMVFINAVGIIMFPVLRRQNVSQFPEIYITLRTLLMVPLLGVLIIYYPLKEILLEWMPHFSDSLKYMALLFPICVYEGKMALLINTYLKTMRKERLMLTINLISVILSAILTLIFTIVHKSLPLAIVSIVLLLAFRCVISEIYLSKVLNVTIFKDILLEIALTMIFILVGWFFSSWTGMLIFLVSYCIYLVAKKREIFAAVKSVKQLLRK